ncbi:hypothetical protein ABEV54_05755 [Peribacillus psychrosaccharolyticus]|uniref:hypothetical protein n=1 Tax=Peribacillus psychrosaccharolyticus TaxID=1407 RepID=UPI003D287915
MSENKSVIAKEIAKAFAEIAHTIKTIKSVSMSQNRSGISKETAIAIANIAKTINTIKPYSKCSK